MSDQIEALMRKKPKRILQNQLLIELIIVVIWVGIIPLVGVLFWAVFGVAPAIVIPVIVGSWAVGSVTSIVVWIYAKIQNRRS